MHKICCFFSKSKKESKSKENNHKLPTYWPEPDIQTGCYMVGVVPCRRGSLDLQAFFAGQYDEDFKYEHYGSIGIRMSYIGRLLSRDNANHSITVARCYKNLNSHLFSIPNYNIEELSEYVKNGGELSKVVSQVYNIKDLLQISLVPQKLSTLVPIINKNYDPNLKPNNSSDDFVSGFNS